MVKYGSLPVVLLREMANLLEGREVAVARAVCCAWSAALGHDALWHRLLRRDLDPTATAPELDGTEDARPSGLGATTWSRRYAARAALIGRWRRREYRQTASSFFNPGNRRVCWVGLCDDGAQSLLVTITSRGFVHVFALPTVELRLTATSDLLDDFIHGHAWICRRGAAALLAMQDRARPALVLWALGVALAATEMTREALTEWRSVPTPATCTDLVDVHWREPAGTLLLVDSISQVFECRAHDGELLRVLFRGPKVVAFSEYTGHGLTLHGSDAATQTVLAPLGDRVCQTSYTPLRSLLRLGRKPALGDGQPSGSPRRPRLTLGELGRPGRQPLDPIVWRALCDDLLTFWKHTTVDSDLWAAAADARFLVLVSEDEHLIVLDFDQGT